jgi:hypothetical protein
MVSYFLNNTEFIGRKNELSHILFVSFSRRKSSVIPFLFVFFVRCSCCFIVGDIKDDAESACFSGDLDLGCSFESAFVFFSSVSPTTGTMPF